MKEKINDLLLKMQAGENCIGDTANELFDLFSVSQRSELLKGDYRQHFIDWKAKFFDYKPKTYEYRSKDGKREYALNGLHKMYERAMLQSPFNLS